MFLKKVIRQKENNGVIQDYVMHTKNLIFLAKKIEKSLFEYNTRFAIDKKKHKKVLGQFQNYFCCRKIFLSPSKNAIHTISIYGNSIIIVFSPKIFPFYLIRYTKFYAKTRKKFFENLMTPFFSQKCRKFE